MFKNIIVLTGLVSCFCGEGMIQFPILTQTGYEIHTMSNVNNVNIDSIHHIVKCIEAKKENYRGGIEKVLLGNTEQNLRLALKSNCVDTSVISSVFITIMGFIQFVEQKKLYNLSDIGVECSNFLKQL